MRLILFSRAYFLVLCLCLSLAKLIVGDCECGYSVNSTSDQNFAVFTELLESDFTKLKDIHNDKDWVVQQWNMGKEVSRGPYGREVNSNNCVSNPRQGKHTRDAGLELWVRALKNPNQDMISCAEVDSNRTDMFYGTFRAGIKHTGVNGTCGAFFWYLNDTQEIDMEFLSSQIQSTTSSVNLVLHSTESLMYGNDASKTPGFQVIQLPFETNKAFHEYRFDWLPGKVSFYADGKWLYDITDQAYIPTSPGKIVLSHWSNGQPLWSGGPPLVDAKMVIMYVKAYFNTTDNSTLQAYQNRCINPNSSPNSICKIPHQIGSPEVNKPYFFSEDFSSNKTPGTTTEGQIEGVSGNDAFSILRRSGNGGIISSWIFVFGLFFGFLLF